MGIYHSLHFADQGLEFPLPELLPWWRGLRVPMTPRSSVVGGFMPLVGSPMANRSGGRGQTKGGSKRPLMMSKINGLVCPSPRRGSPGPPPGARPGGGARGRAPGGRAYTHGARPGTARRDYVGPPSRRLTTSRRGQRGRVHCELGSGRRWGPWRSDPRLQKLALGTWNVTSLVGKEPELVRKVEKFRLDIVGLTSTHSKGSGTSLLERGWTLFHSGVATGERRRAGVAILIAPRLGALYVGVYPGGREGSLPPPSGGGTGPDCCLCLWVQTAVQSIHPFWNPWRGCWKVLPLGIPSFCWGTSTLTLAATVRPGGV